MVNGDSTSADIAQELLAKLYARTGKLRSWDLVEIPAFLKRKLHNSCPRCWNIEHMSY